ncbi:MAG: hypothetical protein FWD48_00985 [Oscillospiraceae bacterium]|nr:hypothetical protein [Oscillospiraceae bacterium]
MKIRIFTSAAAAELEKDVNRFIAQRDIDIVQMQFSTAVTSSVHMAYSVMVTYEAHGLVIENEEAL